MSNQIANIEEFKNTLIINAKKNRYTINEYFEKKTYNDIAIVLNYTYEDETKNNMAKAEMFSQLSEIIIKELELFIMKIINNSIMKRYKIDSICLKDNSKSEIIEQFKSKINSIDEVDSKFIKWIYEKLLYSLNDIENMICVQNLEQYLILNKIVDNYISNIDENNCYNNEEIISIISDYYDLKDKLKKNNIISEEGKAKRIFVKYTISNNKNWIASNDKIECKKSIISGNVKYTDTQSFEKVEFDDRRWSFKKHIEGAVNNEY